MLTAEQQRSRDVALEKAKRAALERDRYDLGAYIPRTSPGFQRPSHVARLLSVFDRIERGEPVFALIEAPPRHSKSETIFHGMARRMLYKPDCRMAYAAYSNQFALRKSRRIRELAVRGGARIGRVETAKDPFGASSSVAFWQTGHGGGLVAGGLHGGFKGEGFHLEVIDDPYKERADFESKVKREAVWEFWTGTFRDRVEPGGSCIITHQRWGDGDLIGQIKEQSYGKKFGTPWEIITIPAVTNYTEDGEIFTSGKPLWPERYDLDGLNSIREDVGEYNWWSQFMQNPRPRGEMMFSNPARFDYDQFQTLGKIPLIGVDTANTTGTRSDQTAIVLGYAWMAPSVSVADPTPKLWVAIYQVIMFKRETPEVVETLKRCQDFFRGAPIIIESTGDGRAAAQQLQRDDPTLQIELVTSTTDKFTRAQTAASMCARQRLLVPRAERPGEKPWLKEYLRILTRFTGVGDKEDDPVDATSNLVNYAAKKLIGGGRGKSSGRSREFTEGF